MKEKFSEVMEMLGYKSRSSTVDVDTPAIEAGI
jgi:hypothetical protein